MLDKCTTIDIKLTEQARSIKYNGNTFTLKDTCITFLNKLCLLVLHCLKDIMLCKPKCMQCSVKCLCRLVQYYLTSGNSVLILIIKPN